MHRKFSVFLFYVVDIDSINCLLKWNVTFKPTSDKLISQNNKNIIRQCNEVKLKNISNFLPIKYHFIVERNLKAYQMNYGR